MPGTGQARYKPKPRAEVRRNMSAIRASENRTETELRRRVHRRGLRFRKYARELAGNPDFIFPTEQVAVFVDGDFWHGRLLLEEGVGAVRERMRTENKAYWIDKFSRRVERDREVTDELETKGWIVLRFWESDLKHGMESAVAEIEAAVRARRRAFD
jgi:DNA mismatch endonuclease (patch repair protein)